MLIKNTYGGFANAEKASSIMHGASIGLAMRAMHLHIDKIEQTDYCLWSQKKKLIGCRNVRDWFVNS